MKILIFILTLFFISCSCTEETKYEIVEVASTTDGGDASDASDASK